MTMEANDFLVAERNIIRCFEEINTMFADIRREWNLKQTNAGNYVAEYEDMRIQVERDKSKILRVTTRCIFFGRTSSGKSTVINALLRGLILPSEKGPVTNSFVEIMKSDGKGEGVDFRNNPGGEEPREPIKNIRRVDRHDSNKIADCSHVRLYFSVEKCPLLKDGVVLTDSPGIDSESDIDSSIQNECSNADVLVLVVNSDGGLGETEQRFLDCHKTMFSKFKILVVFNRWDEISKDREAVLRKEYHETATGYLRNKLKIENNICEGSIFFISAIQRLEMSNKSNSCARPTDSEFERFVNSLKGNLEASRQIREEHNAMMKSLLSSVKCYKVDLQGRLKDKSGKTLEHLGDLNDKLNRDVQSIFDDMSYENFFAFAKKSAKTLEHFENAIKKYLCDIFESLLIKIEGTLETLVYQDHKYIIKILIKFYRRLYINFSKNLTATEISTIRNDCVKINKTIKNHNIYTILGSVAAGVALTAEIGATAGVLLPVATAIAAPALAVGGAAVGGGALGITSKLATNVKAFKRNIYKDRYEDHEKSLKNIWNKMAKVFVDSYSSFVEGVPETLYATMAVTEDKLRVIEKLVDRDNMKWGIMQ